MMKWHDCRYLIIAVFWAGMSMSSAAFANSVITYCKDSNTLAINDTYQVCGNSPVLNPGNLNCQNYTNYREQICASGCDPKTGDCTPSSMDRLIIIAGVIILVLGFIVYLARRY